MTFLRGTTYRQQSTTQRVDLWAQPAALPAQMPAGAAWITGFLRAAMQTASPSAVHEFFRELDAKDRLLSRLGWALIAVIPVFAAFALLASGIAQGVNPGGINHWGVNPWGVNPWIKPIKFSLSFSTFASTMSLLFLALRIPEWQLKLARRAMAASIVLEIISLGAQAWRSVYAAGSHTFADTALAQMTNSMVMVNTAIVGWMLVLFCANRVRTQLADGPMVSAIRYGIVIFLAGNAVGGYMLARGTHTVGAADGGPGLPLVNWSTIGGDLRIAHFIAIHAIQIVPLFAYILSQMAPIPAVKQRRLAILTLAIVVSVAVGATFVQAALGRPFLPVH